MLSWSGYRYSATMWLTDVTPDLYCTCTTRRLIRWHNEDIDPWPAASPHTKPAPCYVEQVASSACLFTLSPSAPLQLSSKARIILLIKTYSRLNKWFQFKNHVDCNTELLHLNKNEILLFAYILSKIIPWENMFLFNRSFEWIIVKCISNSLFVFMLQVMLCGYITLLCIL